MRAGGKRHRFTRPSVQVGERTLNVAPPALMSQDATLSVCGVSSRLDSAAGAEPVGPPRATGAVQDRAV